MINILKNFCVSVSLLATNNCIAQLDNIAVVAYNETGIHKTTSLNQTNNSFSYVTSGNNIALEIKSGKDIYLRRLKNLSGKETTMKASNRFYTANDNKIKKSSDWQLTNVLPDLIANTDSAIVSTPLELLDVTNAIEMIAVDFKKNDQTKCVAFLTKTLGERYTHSKLMADRSKGAQIEGFKMFDIAGYDMLSYKLSQTDGQTENGLEFSIGLDYNADSCNLASNLLVRDNQPSDVFYNFQLWAVNDSMLIELATDIIKKIQKVSSIKLLKTANPVAYIKKIKQTDGQLLIELINNTNDSLLQLQLNNPEEMGNVLLNHLSVNVKPNGLNFLSIPVHKEFTGNILLLKNNILIDSYYILH